MKFRGPRFAILLLASTAIPWGAAEADIFRCQAPDGKMSYSDTPCPRAATRSSNITTAVGACNTWECTAQREQAAEYARERLRSEQEWLAGLTEKRQRAELDAARERARMDELVWRQSVEARLAVTGNETGYVAGYPVYYPIHPVYPAVKPCGWRCAGLQPRRSHGAGAVKRTWGVAARVDRR